MPTSPKRFFHLTIPKNQFPGGLTKEELYLLGRSMGHHERVGQSLKSISSETEDSRIVGLIFEASDEFDFEQWSSFIVPFLTQQGWKMSGWVGELRASNGIPPTIF